MIRHVAMFKWNDDVSDEHIDAISAGLDNLVEIIAEIRGYRHGRDLGLNDGNYDYVVVGDFDSVADYETYRDHPDHRQFVNELVSGRVAARAALQYEID